MKPQHFAVLAGSLLVMALLLLVAGRPAPGKSQADDKLLRTITVVGEGEMRVKPDQVILTFGLSSWTQGASAAEAEALNLASVGRLTDTLKAAGVGVESIQAEQPLVSALTRQDYAGKTYLTGYQAVSRVVVTLTNVARDDAIIAAGLANGATSLDAVIYGVESSEEARRKVVQAAIENALGRATAIATARDQTLGEMLSVEVIEEESPAAGSTVSPGPLLFRARVRATYTY